ncbi:MAG TPA: hypothetical protein DCY47_08675 [Candidatus Accumulibacter sp.]|nr:hypothetical protein [Accumulibacter sp.]
MRPRRTASRLRERAGSRVAADYTLKSPAYAASFAATRCQRGQRRRRPGSTASARQRSAMSHVTGSARHRQN